MGGRGPASVGSFEAGQAASGRLGAAAAQTLASAVGVRLSRAEAPDREVLVPQIIQLLRALPGEVREPVLAEALKVIATDDAASPQLARLAASLPPADVLRGLRRLAREQAQLSSHALHMVQTLAAADEGGAVGAAVLADPAVNFAELAELFRDEDVDRYNPEDHRVLLNQTPTVDLASVSADAAAEPDAVGVESESDDAVDRRMLATLLDLAAAFPEADNPLVFGRLREFFVRALQVRRFDQAIAIIRGVREIAEVPAEGGQRRPIADFLDRLADAQILAALVAASRQPGGPPFVQVQSIVLALGAWGARGVLGALAEEPDRVRRLRLLDLAASIGPAIVPETTRMLSDPRWYVVRNMVLLLRRVQDRTAMVQIRRCADHADLRVRLEAIRALFAFDTQLPRDLLARAIHHPDPRLAEAAVLLTGQHGITQAIDLLVEILLRWDPLGRKRSLRLKALRALSDLGDAAVLPRIGRFFRDWPIPIIALEERRAAYRLLSGYDEVARAPYAARGARSRDAMIREICRGLVKSAAPAPERA
ncbi:MAG TPA: HEAT repeat domain-containing protein [Candidatus Dormibacteraeota bacterium]|nr:HEAT repeat domain-containing protein [Candidatus Dormibacteraeota bacterium]